MCKCGGCTCNIAADLEKKRDEDKVHQFLLGLDEDVCVRSCSVRASIISTDPMPSMNQVYSKIKSVERVNTVIRGREQRGAKTAFDVKKRIWKRREKQVLYGVQKEYPEWWGEQKRQAGRGGGRGGRGRGGMTMRANAVQAAVEHLKPVLKPNWRIRSKVLAGLVRSLFWIGYDETQGNYICTRYLEL